MLSATADLADIVLPACTYLEKTDLLSSNNFYLQYMPKVIEPLWESKSDLEAITLVAGKMGVGKYFDKSADEYLKEILHIGDPKADGNVNGLTWDQLTTSAPHLNTPTIPYVPFFDKKFPTKSGRIEFYVERLIPYDQQLPGYKEPIEATPTNPLCKKYPLTFLSTHTRFRTHSQFVNLPWLKEINNGGQGFLEINPVDAKPRGIARRRRRQGVQRPRLHEGAGAADRGDQARRRQLLPGRLGHDQGQALHRGPSEQPDPPDREPGPVGDPELPLERGLLRLPRGSATGRSVIGDGRH